MNNYFVIKQNKRLGENMAGNRAVTRVTQVLYEVFCETEDHSIAVKEICLAALTLYARDKAVR